MKKISKLFLVALIAGLSALSVSCTYPENNWFSLKNPEYRVIGTWQITHSYLNGEEVDSTNTYHANDVGAYFYFYPDYVLNVMTVYNGQIRQSTYGTWYFQNKNKELVLDFTILGKNYSYVAYIKKFSNKELFYEYDDRNGNHWRLEMYSRTAY